MKRVIQKTAEANGDLIDNKKADKIRKVSRSSLQNTSDIVEIETKNKELDKETPKNKFIFPEKRQEIIDDQR